MKRSHVLGGILVAVAIAAGIGVALYTGAGPAPGGDGGEPITDFPTETPSDDGSTVDESGQPPPFSFTIDEIDDCGQTCRDVTVTLYNNQDGTGTGITVYTRIFAGRNNTDTDDLVWENREDVGTLEAGGTYTTTERVELSIQEGLKIERNDGWITILTAVQSDDRTVTFRDSEQVA